MNLRLDMYINSKEFCIGEASATKNGFEELLNLSDIVDGRIANELRTLGVSNIPAELRNEGLLDLVYEISDVDVKDDDEINFCMCLWDNGEHMQSSVKIETL